MGSLLHQANHAVQGAVSCIIFAAATFAELGMAPQQPSRHPRRTRLFLAGLALIVAGLAAASLVLFLADTVVGGIAAGAIFVGSLSIPNRFAPQESRGQVVSTYFVFAYAGLIIPVVGVGFASDYVGDFPAVLGCSIALAALCVLSATGISGRGRAARTGHPAAPRTAFWH